MPGITDLPDSILLSIWPPDQILDALAVGNRSLATTLRKAPHVISRVDPDRWRDYEDGGKLFHYDGFMRIKPSEFVCLFSEIRELDLQWQTLDRKWALQAKDKWGSKKICPTMKTFRYGGTEMDRMLEGFFELLPPGLEVIEMKSIRTTEMKTHLMLENMPVGLKELVITSSVVWGQSEFGSAQAGSNDASAAVARLPRGLVKLDLSNTWLSSDEKISKYFLHDMPDTLKVVNFNNMNLGFKVGIEVFLDLPQSIETLLMRDIILERPRPFHPDNGITEFVRSLPTSLTKLDISGTIPIFEKHAEIFALMPKTLTSLDIGHLWLLSMHSGVFPSTNMDNFPPLKHLGLHSVQFLNMGDEERIDGPWQDNLRNLLGCKRFALESLAIRKTYQDHWTGPMKSAIWKLIGSFIPNSVKTLDVSTSEITDWGALALADALEDKSVEKICVDVDDLTSITVGALGVVGQYGNRLVVAPSGTDS